MFGRGRGATRPVRQVPGALARAIEQARIGLDRLARVAGVHPSMLTSMLRGDPDEHYPPSVRRAVAAALGLDEGDLFFINRPAPPAAPTLPSGYFVTPADDDDDGDAAWQPPRRRAPQFERADESQAITADAVVQMRAAEGEEQ